MATHRLSVSADCPGHHNVKALCGRCLRAKLQHQQGVRSLALRPETTSALATLELEFDPNIISREVLDAEVKRFGVCESPDRAEMVLGVDGMVSPRNEQMIEAALSKLPGVSAHASFATRSIRIEFDRRNCTLPEIARRLDEVGGFRLRQGRVSAETHVAEHRSRFATLVRLIRAEPSLASVLLGGVLLLAAFLVHRLLGPQWSSLRIALIIPAYALTGWGTFIDTAKVLWARRFDIDVLMFAAAIGAAAIGYYEEGGLLLFLFGLGGAGEELAMDRARRAINALSKLAPETATLRTPDGRYTLVKIETLAVGDTVVVGPFERLPADGTVTEGNSSIDQSPITGESVPVDKSSGSDVFAGTINGEGALVVRVSKLAAESTLAKIVKLVNEAHAAKSPTQLFAEAVERRYVPIVLITTALLILVPPAVFHASWHVWFYRSMAFLTAASPCALAIGTPATILSGIARAARAGVLVKGGVHLENLGRVRAIAFDKTGTLTRGRPEVTEIAVVDSSFSEDDSLALAAAIERSSAHPLAKAIVAEAVARELAVAEASEVGQTAGRGIRGIVAGRRVEVGRINPRESAELTVATAPLIDAGRTIVGLWIDDRATAVFGLSDRPRSGAADTLGALKRIGIERTVMLSGDHQAVATATGKALGIDECIGDLLPQDKLGIISELKRRFGYVAMVGDGVNDAPALASADVGIAMGGAGTDVALETADVALMSDDLARLPQAIAISRFCRRLIKQNLFIALGVIAVLAPLSALGYTYLGVAVLFHEGSTVLVVLNAMRLLGYNATERPEAQKAMAMIRPATSAGREGRFR